MDTFCIHSARKMRTNFSLVYICPCTFKCPIKITRQSSNSCDAGSHRCADETPTPSTKFIFDVFGPMTLTFDQWSILYRQRHRQQQVDRYTLVVISTTVLLYTLSRDFSISCRRRDRKWRQQLLHFINCRAYSELPPPGSMSKCRHDCDKSNLLELYDSAKQPFSRALHYSGGMQLVFDFYIARRQPARYCYRSLVFFFVCYPPWQVTKGPFIATQLDVELSTRSRREQLSPINERKWSSWYSL